MALPSSIIPLVGSSTVDYNQLNANYTALDDNCQYLDDELSKTNGNIDTINQSITGINTEVSKFNNELDDKLSLGGGVLSGSLSIENDTGKTNLVTASETDGQSASIEASGNNNSLGKVVVYSKNQPLLRQYFNGTNMESYSVYDEYNKPTSNDIQPLVLQSGSVLNWLLNRAIPSCGFIRTYMACTDTPIANNGFWGYYCRTEENDIEVVLRALSATDEWINFYNGTWKGWTKVH